MKVQTITVATLALALGWAAAAPASTITITDSFTDDNDKVGNFTGTEIAVAEARWGNNSSGNPLAGDQEILVRPGDTFATDAQDQIEWSGTFDYSLSFLPESVGDASDVTMRFTAAGTTVQYNYDLSDAGLILFRAAAGSVPLSLDLVDQTVTSPAGDETYRWVSGIDYAQGGEITGSALFAGGAAGSRPAFQFKVTDIALSGGGLDGTISEVPVPASLAFMLPGAALVTWARRRR